MTKINQNTKIKFSRKLEHKFISLHINFKTNYHNTSQKIKHHTSVKCQINQE
jgi:hypothetical protein